MDKKTKKETEQKVSRKYLLNILLSSVLVLSLLTILKYTLEDNLVKKNTLKSETEINLNAKLDLSLSYIRSMNLDNDYFGVFKELTKDDTPGFIATNQVIGLFPLENSIPLSERDKQYVIHFLNQFQNSSSGLYNSGKKAKEKQSFSHYDSINNDLFFTALSVYTLNKLNEKPEYLLNFLKEYDTPAEMIEWIKHHKNPWTREWSVEFFSITIPMLLVGSPDPDFEKNKWVKEVFDYLDTNRDKNTGFWKTQNKTSGDEYEKLQNGLVVAAHLWPSYHLANRTPILSYPDKIIDSTLALQRADGHFMDGASVEDLDGALSLSNSYFLTDYRKEEVEQSLVRLATVIIRSQNEDGGFGFFEHSSTSSVSDTVIRLITLALILQVDKSFDTDMEIKPSSLFFPYDS